MKTALIVLALLLNGCFFIAQLPTTASRAPITRIEKDGREKTIGSHRRAPSWSVYGAVTVAEW
jgi:hypothetical protein